MEDSIVDTILGIDPSFVKGVIGFGTVIAVRLLLVPVPYSQTDFVSYLSG